MEETIANKTLKVPHHEQLKLCTTRLPYRQGRRLTAIKVYTVVNESKHLLIFGVPVLNLRQELKSLLTKYGKVQNFGITENYPNELFTETYHVLFERIQSARFAKKKLDTYNFYGGVLHVCYAPELETIDEVREKLQLRKKEVMQRLQRNGVDARQDEKPAEVNSVNKQKDDSQKQLINMGEVNVISKNVNNIYAKVSKRTAEGKSFNIQSKKAKSPFLEKSFQPKLIENKDSAVLNKGITLESIEETVICIEKPLNFNKFGNEVIKKYQKPLNKIVFTLDK